MFLVLLVLTSQTLVDFQVNNEDYPSKAHQWFSAITNYDSGGVAIWTDLRLPNNGQRVFATRLDTNGDTIGTNFRVDDHPSNGGCGNYQDVACAYDGSFIGVWTQHENTVGRRFSNNGMPVGPSFIINDSSAECRNPAVTVDSARRTAVVWSDNRDGQARIYCQTYDEVGNPIGTNVPVSDSAAGSEIRCDAALTSHKDIIVVWAYYGDIWCQRLDSLGNAIVGNFKAWNDTIGRDEDYPAVRCAYDGDFMIAWSSYFRGDIFCRIFDSSATPATDVIKINEPPLVSSRRPKIALYDDSVWCIVWDDTARTVHMQMVSCDGSLIGNNVRVDSSTGLRNIVPDVGTTDDFIFVTWTRTNNYTWDIMIQQIAPDGALVGGNHIITDDMGGEAQRMPAIAADTTGDFFIVWNDLRNPEYWLSDMYGRMFDAQGNPFAHDFRINDMNYGFYSAIAVNKLGLYVSVWANDSTHQVYGQRFDRNGTPLGSNFQISQVPGNTGVYGPKVSALSNRRFIVVWGDGRTLPARIYGRILDSLGIPLGNEFTASIDTLCNTYPCCIVDQGESTFVLGMGSDDAQSVAIQQFDYDVNPISDPIILNDVPVNSWYVAGAKGINGYFFIWSRYYSEGSGRLIYGQFLDENLQKIEGNFLIGDDSTWCQENASVVSRANGEYFVVWQDHRDFNYDIYAQSFDSLGNKVGDNFRIDNDTTNAWQWEPACVSQNDLIYITWTDNRVPEHYFDIYCTVMEWPDLGVCEHNESNPQQLMSIAPNPFHTTLTMKINSIHGLLQNPKIVIYDISGRLVKELSLLTAYSLLPTVITWDGTDSNGVVVPAGVYFLRTDLQPHNVVHKVVKIR